MAESITLLSKRTNMVFVQKRKGNFVNYDASHEKECNETITKVICGENVSYKRLQTTGSLQGEGVYKITLSKSLDE